MHSVPQGGIRSDNLEFFVAIVVRYLWYILQADIF